MAGLAVEDVIEGAAVFAGGDHVAVEFVEGGGGLAQCGREWHAVAYERTDLRGESAEFGGAAVFEGLEGLFHLEAGGEEIAHVFGEADNVGLRK